MTLFIEYVIMDNMVIDYLLVGLIECVTKERFKIRNKIFASIIGTSFALLLPYISKYNILALIYKILCAVIMTIVLKKYKTFKNYFWNLALLFVFTFLFGGLLICLLSMAGIEYTTTSFILYNFEIPISVFLIVFCSGYWLLKKIIKALSNQLKYNNFTHKIMLIDNDEKVECVGYFDSGNMLCKNGQAVNIISSEIFFKLYQNYSIDKLLFRNIDHSILKDASYIEIQSLSKSCKYLSFKIDKFIVEEKEYSDVYFAVTLNKFENFDCIINSNVLGGTI